MFVPLSVEVVIGSLNVIVTLVPTATPVALGAGVRPLMVGGVMSPPPLPTVMDRLTPGASRLPLSSTDRARKVTVPLPAAVQVKFHDSRPLARRQVAPLSVE